MPSRRVPCFKSEGQSEAEFERECAGDAARSSGVDAADVTAAIRFLLATPSITGQMIALDGGQHLGCGKPGKRVSSGAKALKQVTLRPYLRPSNRMLPSMRETS